MRAKLLGGVAALALAGCMVTATAAPASAAWGWHGGWHHGWGGWGWGGAAAAGVIGGAVAAATASDNRRSALLGPRKLGATAQQWA